MCIRSNGALAVGIAALTVTAGKPLAASLSAHAHEWATDDRRPYRVPPMSVRALDTYEVGVPALVQQVHSQVVDGQLAIEVIEITAPEASDSAELRFLDRADPWELLPGESAVYGVAIARGVHFCDAIT